MKTLALLTLLSAAAAAPALQEDASDHLQGLDFQAHRSIPESVSREKKSPSESKSSQTFHSSAPNTGNPTDIDIPIQTGRSFALKTPVIVKKKFGYHLYRDSEEEKANADSHEQCGRQVKVKLCDEDGKFREMLRSSGHEISDSSSENDMKHSIMMAREAIENLQRDFKRIEQKSAFDKLDSKPDTDLHDDIEITRQALEDIHKNFENLESMSLHATALRNSDAMKDLHIRLANTEEEKMAQWKAAIENIHKNVEIVENIENSFKSIDDQEKLLQLDQTKRTSTNDDKMLDKGVHVAMEEHTRDAQSDNLKNANGEGQNTDKPMIEHAREEQGSEEDIASSASEVVEMKTVNIGNHHSLRSENHRRIDPEINTELEIKEQGTDVHNEITNNDEKLNKNADEQIEGPFPDVHNIDSLTGASKITSELSTHERKTEADDKMKESHSAEKIEENNIQNEINEGMATTPKNTENKKSMLDDHHDERNESSQNLPKDDGDNKEFDDQKFDKQTENTVKAASPSDNIPLNDLHLGDKHHNIDYNDSEHTTTLTEMKSAEDHLHHLESKHFNAQTGLDNTAVTSVKTADPSDQVPLNVLGLQPKHHNIDYNESEHTTTLTEMKAAENNLHHQISVLNALEHVEDNLHHAVSVPFNTLWGHENRPLISMKAADPSDQSLNNLNLERKHYNIDYNESEHTTTLTEMKTAENNISPQLQNVLEDAGDNFHHTISKALNEGWDQTRPLISMKTADPSDQVHSNDFSVQHKHNIDYNESDHTASFTEMKAADDNINHHLTVLKAMEAAGDNLDDTVSEQFNAPWASDGSLTSMKAADPTDQMPLNDLHLHHKHQHDIDYNESEHTSSLTQMKTSEDHMHPSPTLRAMEDPKSHLLNPESKTFDPHRSHESRQMTVMKAAEPFSTLKDLNINRKPFNIDLNEMEHTPTLVGMKSADDHVQHHFTELTRMKDAEDHFHHPESIGSNQGWSQEKQTLASMKMADPANQLFLQQNLNHHGFEDTAKLSDMKTTEDQRWTPTEMKAAENNFHPQHSILSTNWGNEKGLLPSRKTVQDFRNNRHELEHMRHSHMPDHQFTQNKIGHSSDLESSEHAYQHPNFPHRHHHHLIHSDPDDMSLHSGMPSHSHPSLRDAMEGLETEHTFRWKPSHESFRNSFAANPISSSGAIGVFPNANTGGCGIPLLLSCSPSVVSGSLAKPHGTSYLAPSYSVPSYRTEEDFGFHNKRDTKKMHDMRNTNALRSPAIVKQKTRTIIDSKM